MMVWVVEKKIIDLFLLVGSSMNVFNSTVLSALREMGIQRDSQIKNLCPESYPQPATLYSYSE